MSDVNFTEMTNVTYRGKHIGVIKKVDNGLTYAFFQIGDDVGGRTYVTMESCKDAIRRALDDD